MGWSCDSNMDGVCWVLALVVVAVLIYLGCCELRKPPPPAAPASSGGEIAARRATTTTAAPQESAAEPKKAAAQHEMPTSAHGGVPLQEAFQEIDVDRSMERIGAPADSYLVPDSVFMNEFNDAEKTPFKPINKEQALRSANIRPKIQNSRGDAAPGRARRVGLSPMEFARKTIHRTPSTAACVAFNDTDSRHVEINEATDCFASESCPWQK